MSNKMAPQTAPLALLIGKFLRQVPDPIVHKTVKDMHTKCIQPADNSHTTCIQYVTETRIGPELICLRPACWYGVHKQMSHLADLAGLANG